MYIFFKENNKSNKQTGGIVPENQKNIVTGLSNDLKPIVQKLATNITKLHKASEDLNLKIYIESYIHFERDLRTLIEIWDIHEKSGGDLVSKAIDWLNSTEYPQVLETHLRDLKVPFTGSFPDYEIPPFKLSIQVDKRFVKLSMGKKSQQTNIFAPEPLAKWVSAKYQALINSTFNSDQLCKEILEAYPYLSSRSWGMSVSLKDIYQLLTLKGSTKKEYPESIFVFDLGRLLENRTIEYKGHSFDFQPHNTANKNYAVVNSKGRERQLGLISIYKVE